MRKKRPFAPSSIRQVLPRGGQRLPKNGGFRGYFCLAQALLGKPL
jgi:hypothetical protein